MANQINRFTDRKLTSISKPGRHADDGGLYLVEDQTVAKRWAFMSWRGARQIEIGIGGLGAVGLKKARHIATNCRLLVQKSEDPRKAVRAQRKVPQFGEFALEVIASLEAGFRASANFAQGAGGAQNV